MRKGCLEALVIAVLLVGSLLFPWERLLIWLGLLS